MICWLRKKKKEEEERKKERETASANVECTTTEMSTHDAIKLCSYTAWGGGKRGENETDWETRRDLDRY